MDHRVWSLVCNTALLAGTATAISLPPGVALAWLLVRTDLYGRRAALLLFGLMVFVPLYLQAAAWQAGFGIQGWFTLGWGLPPWLDGWTGAVWVHAMAALPWTVLIAGAGLWLVEPELEEQALLDALPWRVALRVTFPGAAGAIAVAALWTLIVTAGEMTVTDLFAVRTFAEEVYTQQAVADPNSPLSHLLAAVALVTCLVLSGLVVAAKLFPRDRPVSAARRVVFSPGRWRCPIAGVVGLVLLWIVGVPLASLAYKAGVVVTQVGQVRIRSWSPGKCLEMIAASPWEYRSQFAWSLVISTLAATAATALAIALGWAARRGRLRGAAALAVAAGCLAVPGPILGLGVIWLMNRPEIPLLVYLYDQSICAPWLALTVRGLGPAALVMWHALRTVPEEMLDCAAVDGAGPLARLRWIALPSRRWAVALAWLVAMAVALGDLAASVLVVPPGLATLSIHIFGLLHYGVEDRVAGICLAQALLFAALAAAALWLANRWRREIQPP